MDEPQYWPEEIEWRGVRVYRRLDGDPIGWWVIWYVKSDGSWHGPEIEHLSRQPSEVETKLREGEWVNGLPHGLWRQWDRQGKLLGSWELVHGTGLCLGWRENGSLAYEGRLQQGERTGVWKFYTSVGTVDAWVTYENGTEVACERTGDVEWFGGRSGTCIKVDENGRRTFEGYLQDGRREGTWKYFSPGGHTERDYRNGVDIGSRWVREP